MSWTRIPSHHEGILYSIFDEFRSDPIQGAKFLTVWRLSDVDTSLPVKCLLQGQIVQHITSAHMAINMDSTQSCSEMFWVQWLHVSKIH